MIRTPDQTRDAFPVGTVVEFVEYGDHVHGVGFEPGDRLEVVGHSTDCGDDGLRVRRIADGVRDLVFSTEVRVPHATPRHVSDLYRVTDTVDEFVETAGRYHDGQFSALYALASTGSLELYPGEGLDRLRRELREAIDTADANACRAADDEADALAEGDDEAAFVAAFELAEAETDADTLREFAAIIDRAAAPAVDPADVAAFVEYVCEWHATDRPDALAPVAPSAVLAAAVAEYVADWSRPFEFDGDTLDREAVRDRVRAAQRAEAGTVTP